MLTPQEVSEIREHLENAQNPVFFFDNDPDGLCSFLLLQRFIGRGRGIAIKSLPGLSGTYFKRVEELKADYIFVVDKPIIDDEFIAEAEKANIPVVHIDHHNVAKSKAKYYYNTYYSSKKNEPVSYLCYKITNRKEDMWIASIGCVTDCYLPDFIEELRIRYPELIETKYHSAFDILYNSTLGKLAMLLSFGLRDTTTNVVSMMKLLMNAKNPYDLISENLKTKNLLNKFEEINQKYQKILKKAEESIDGDILFFNYAGDLSISQYVANELIYKYPHKAIVVVYTKGNISNLSLRWEKDIRIATVNAIKDIDGASGGGHEHASGARMPADQILFFKERLLGEIKRIEEEEDEE